MYITLAIYRLNIMFRHMPLPRDTSVFESEIIIVCYESVPWETAKLCPKTDFRNL